MTSTSSSGVASRRPFSRTKNVCRRDSCRWTARSAGTTGTHSSSFGLHLFVAGGQHLDAGEDEERAEDVDDPVEALRCSAAPAMMKTARITSAPKMPQKSTRCCRAGGHLEVREEHQEDEDVVDRERLLDQVAGDELQRVRRTGQAEQPQREDQRERDPHQRPRERLANG